MGTGFRGAFVISWSQTQLDGLSAAPIETLSIGAAWSWHGDIVRIDGPNGILRLEGTDREAIRRRCAAKLVSRLLRAATGREGFPAAQAAGGGAQADGGGADGGRADGAQAQPELLGDAGFVVTDGRKAYSISVVPVPGGAAPLLLFLDDIPPKGRELWVVHHALEGLAQSGTGRGSGGVICFTPGTRIETPLGPRLVEELREGDLVRTKDNGAQPVLWIGSRRMSGARLFAMPHLRPIRIRAGGLGIGQPDHELLVSPEHRLLIRGTVAQRLFNTPEVLVSARDLVNDGAVAVDMGAREVCYIHLLLPRHQILWANGVETESFHPASAALSTLDAQDRARLLELDPQLALRPEAYGAFARRALNSSEAALLLHEAA
ncbi:MAG: hypothetical protein Kow0058_09030 [Roseovarius sp.]